jgi:hypothetical protein
MVKKQSIGTGRFQKGQLVTIPNTERDTLICSTQ